jgi:hypothetical protein
MEAIAYGPSGSKMDAALQTRRPSRVTDSPGPV